MAAGSNSDLQEMPPMSAPASLFIGWLAAFGAVVVWSGWVVVSRLGIIQTLTIYDLMALRFFVAAVAIAPFLWRYWPHHLRWWQTMLISLGQGAPYLALAFGGLHFAPASHAGIMMNGTLPVFAALLGWLFLNDRPDRWRCVGMLAILIGCSLIGWDRESAGAEPDAWIGHLMFLAAALLVAANLIGTKAWQLTGLQMMVLIPTVNLLWFGPIYLAYLPKAIGEAPWTEILLQGAYQGLGPGLFGLLWFANAIRSIGASPTAAVMAMAPGMAALLAIPILGEWPSDFAWTGLILTTGGILLTAGWQLGQPR